MKKLFFVYILALVSIFVYSCDEVKYEKPLVVTSTFPLYTILKEIVGNELSIEYLVPTGASPHTYQPKPSDAKKATSALALFYTADNLDGWISEIADKKRIKLIDYVPLDKIIFFSCGHDHSNGNHEEHEHEVDPHFWLDPLTVKSMLDTLVFELSALYPDGKKKFVKNASVFSAKLDSIHNEALSLLNPIAESVVFMHHPSFNYLLNRYNLYYGGAIEESPGKEPSPKFISDLVELIKQSGAKAIFSEPQLSSKVAEVIAKESGVKLLELNPEGSSNGAQTYREIIINNAKILKSGLE